MKKLTLPGFILLMAMLSLNVYPQTGYFEDFNQTSEQWLDDESNNYRIHLMDGSSTIEVFKQEPWQSVGYDLGGSYDLTANPYAGFKVKSDVSFQLHLYIVSGSTNVLRTVRIYPSDEWVSYFIDYTDYENFNIADVTKILVAANGTSIGWEGSFMMDDLALGDQVVKSANLTGISDQHFGAGKKKNVIRIKDVTNSTGISVSGGESLVENISVSPVIKGVVTVRFDTKVDAQGTESITILASGAPGYEDNSTSFDLTVSGNNPPYIDDNIPALETGVGKEATIQLSGISDGNPESDQMLNFIVSSDHQTALPDSNMSVEYLQGSSNATLYLTTTDAGLGINVSITVMDDGERNPDSIVTFAVNSYTAFNEFPEIDNIREQKINIQNGLYSLMLTGISDGNDGSQNLTFTASSSNQEVLPDDSVRIVDFSGGNTATLEMNPIETGSTTITLELADDGTGADNGPLSIEQIFDVEVSFPLPTGRTITFDGDVQTDLDRGLWTLHDGQGGKFTVSYVDSGSFQTMKVDCNDKFYWDGFNLVLEVDTALDISENPYLSMEVYSVDDATLHWIWFYDNTGTRNNVTNRNRENMFWAPAGEWTDIRFDFSQENDLLNNNSGEPVNASNIIRVLFNMHNADFQWPPPVNYNGTFYIRNLRLGSDALTPEFTPMTTIDPVPDMTLFDNAGLQEITLTGISDGGDGTNTPVVTATSSNTSFVSDPSVSAVSEGMATLSFTSSEVADTATITLTITASGSNPSKTTFFVQSFTEETTDASGITVDVNQKYQEIKGFGTFMNIPSLSDFYVDEMGASAMRMGLIGNQLEVVNDNEDPYSIDRSKLNYNAFDWDYFRDLKERGVETFILTSWSPPAWMKQNLATDWSGPGAPNYNQTNNQLEEYLYEEFAESMVIAIKVIKEETEIDIKAIGPQNEPAFNEPYASAILSPEYFAKLIAVIGKRFEMEGLNTKIFMPEQVFSQNHYSMFEYMDAVQANPDANKYTDIIAVHGYASDGIGSGTPNFSQWTNMYNEAQQGEFPKEFWMTETFRAYSSYEDAMWIATAIYGSLEYGNIGLWTQWSFDGQHVQNAQPTQMLYVCSNFFKYIRPGAVRVNTVSGNDDLLATSYVHEGNGTFTMVVINQGQEAHKAYVSGQGLPGQYHLYRTSEFEKAIDLGMSNDSILLFPPRSVTTIVATGNMAPTIDQVADMTLMQDAPVQEINLTGISYGADELPQNIVVLKATSDNTDLIPNPTIGTLTNGQAELTFQPQTGQTATVTISVTVEDDGSGFGFNSTTMTFDVEVFSSFNNAPSFDRIYDHFTKEDEGEQTITVTGLMDGDGGTQSLVGAATSDNTGLIPSIIFVDEGSGNATLTFTPPANIHGEAIVRLTLTDDGGEAGNNGDQSYYQTFKVFVAPVNDVPEVDEIDNQTVGLNANEKVITLTGLSDGEPFGSKQQLSITAASSDPSIIDHPTITYSGGNTANLTFQPEQEQTGTVTINVLVQDDGGVANGGVDTANTSFDIEVMPASVNNAPTINDPADVEIALNDGMHALSVSGVSDGDGGSQNLTVNAVSSNEDAVASPDINYENGWTYVEINLTPLQAGTSTITITLKDDGGVENGGADSVQVSFVVTVTGTIGIEDVPARLSMYPNPAKERINVKLPANHEFTGFTLIDPAGKKIKMRSFSQNTRYIEIDLNDLAAGEYILVLTGKSKILRLNVLVEK
jgi:glucuronoarabinoxylan endo-1,4-beta-xylanase